MTLSWDSVTQKEEYIKLLPEDKEKAKKQYFDSVVLPRVPEGKRDMAWDQFYSYTKKGELKKEEPGFLNKFMADTKRIAGVGIGVLNSPTAFVWGSQQAQHLNPEEYKKLSPIKKALVSMGGGFDSAWRSISKKKDWGTLYGEYYESVTGDTIEEDLPEGLKWAAPTIEFIANIVSDPLVLPLEAANLAKLKVPKGYRKAIPQTVLNDLDKIEKLEKSQKELITGTIKKGYEARKDYKDWWKGKLAKAEEMADEKGFKDRNSYASSWERGTLEKNTEKTGKPLIQPKIQTEKSSPPVVKTNIVEKTETEIAQKIKDQRFKKRKPQVDLKTRKAINDFRKKSGLPEMKIPGHGVVEERRAAEILKNLNTFRKQKGLPELTKRLNNEKGSLDIDFKALKEGTTKIKGYMDESPSWVAVHNMVGKNKQTISVSGMLGKINTTLLDRLAPLNKVSKDAYKNARMYSAYKDQAKIKFDELKFYFKDVKNAEVFITDYITAHRAMNRAERGFKNPNGVTLKESKSAIAEIERAYVKHGGQVDDLKFARDAFQEWTHEYILKEAFESGIISKASFAKIEKDNNWYAAFDVLDHIPDDVSKIPVTGQEFFSVGNQKIIKGLKGTVKKIRNPIEGTIDKFMKAQQLFARNKVANSFIDDKTITELFRPVAASPKEAAIMKRNGLKPVLAGSWNGKKFDTISRFKDGKMEKYLVDKELADTMKQLSTKQAPKVVHALNSLFRKSATTAYLPFTISNASRDFLMAYTTAPVYKWSNPHKFVKDWGKGFWEGAKHEFLGSSKLTDDYIKHGGGFGYVGNIRTAKIAKDQLFKKGIIKKAGDIVKSPIDLLEKISATIELAPRLGTFDRAKITGLPMDDAALMARQSTIDFNRGGTFTKVANQWVPFLNARVQGRVTLASALKRDPKGTIAKAVTATAIPGMATYAWNRLYHSELYDDIPEYVKQNYFTLIIGTDKDDYGKIVPKYLTISKGDIGQMVWNPLEFGLDQRFKDDPEGAKAFFVNYLNDLSPVEFAREGKLSATKMISSVTPPAVKGVVEGAVNLNFYHGTEIVPHWMEKTVPPELQYKEHTPELYKKIGKQLGISPLKVQNMAGNIIAGYGREGGSLDAMLRGLTGRLIKTRGGEIRRQAFITIKDIENGYTTAMSYAKNAVVDGNEDLAIDIITDWNDGLAKQIEAFDNKFKKYNIHDKGGLTRSYLFTPQKIKNIMIQKEKQDPLEKRLTRTKR